jgi:glycosyltransferase involved in cell wall biosynthesis
VRGLNREGLNQFVACRKGSRLEDYCRKEGIPCLSLPFLAEFDLISAWRLKAFCSRQRISLLHLHTARAHSVAVLSWLLGNKRPLILSRRVAFPVRTNFFSRFKYNHPAISRILCVSETVRNGLAKGLDNPSRCATVYSSIELGRFGQSPNGNRFRGDLALEHDQLLIGNIGALTREKDHLTFLHTARLLAGRIKAKFLIVGDGPLKGELEQAISRLGLQDLAVLLGSRHDVPELLGFLDLLLFTSRAEGCPNCVIEAFAAGVPVVAAAAAGTAELVSHGVTGLLAPKGNAYLLAEQVMRLASDSELRANLIRNARAKAEQYSTERMVAATHGIYREVVGI